MEARAITELPRALLERILIATARRALSPDRLRPQLAARPSHPRAGGPFAAYVHIPFCRSSCRYCIFPKTTRDSQAEAYVAGLLDEIDAHGRSPLLRGRALCSLHIGGGTPSVLPASQITSIVARLRRWFAAVDGLQITLEANPDSLDLAELPRYADAGINRISLGVQSLDDRLLKRMGRSHSASQALAAIAGLRGAGLADVGVDLMYGFADQREERFVADLRSVAASGATHVSAFPLIELGGRRWLPEPGRDAARRSAYRALVETMRELGFDRYSSEDFAATTSAKSRYQIDAWRFPRRDVVGLGAGALGSLSGYYYANEPRIDRYLASLRTRRFPVARATQARPDAAPWRDLLLGAKFLRVDRAAFRERFGAEPEQVLWPLLGLGRRAGLWIVDRDGMRMTERGLQLTSAIWSELILRNVTTAER
jgi:oxygen-independent coproporphyrinogen-3 oxidase